jgi:F-type H+-transporting ATPase subunit delta
MAKATAARRYAKALFAIASDEQRIPAVREELARLSGLFTAHAELERVLLQPLHPAAQRRAALVAAAERVGASPLLRHFLSFLVDQRRLVDFALIESEYGRLADAAAGLTKARVRSAAPLSEAQQQRLRSALERKSGARVQLEIEVDPGLVAGAVAQVGDLVFDGSLRTQLKRLRASLVRG